MTKILPTVSALALALGVAGLGWGPAAAQEKRTRSPIGSFGQNSKQPINIEADELRVLQTENQAIYTGNVVAVQGDTTMKCTKLTVFFETKGGGKTGLPVRPAAGGGDDGEKKESAIRKLECAGPVSVVSKDQVATSRIAVYDRVAGLVTMTGNVALSQNGNVTRGEQLIYNINTGVAQVKGGRVQGLFIPGSGGDDKKR